ncbi:MAG: patatin-like phospholipase family protein, partial [Myxococcales bacterium]|nr:patatin-like phospholipase family protein [Myxococcales bacterium]
MDFDAVFREELEELGARRARARARARTPAADADASPENPPENHPENRDPAPADDLIGLCFSGGGIRSASFSLGILRGLHRWGLLRTVDYLSTVSGGGYIGAYLMNLYRRGDEAEVLASGDRGRRSEPPGVKRLRGMSRFVTPTQSAGEWLQALLVIVRGTLWNCAVFTFLAVTAAAVGAFLLDADGRWIFPFPHGIATFTAVAAAALLLMLSALRARLPSGGALLFVLIAAGLTALVDGLPAALALAERHYATFEAIAALSGLVALVGSGALPSLSRRLYLLMARLVALLLVALLPVALFLVLLARFNAGADPLTVALQIGALALLPLLAVVDFNRTSLHGFYRARVNDAFLEGQAPKLSDFRGQRGPLHLLNATINAPRDPDPRLRDRRGDFFTFSCLHVGGPRTGYVATEAFEAATPGFDTASAIAISGAAAAPNMGNYTDALVRPLLALLNVRMSYWAPNPRLVGQRRRGGRAWLPYLFKEITGDLRSDQRLVNLSDGGHLENLGAFELLRRKCKLIIVGDGEQDVAMSFGAIAALVRLAQTELDAEIDLDLDDLRLDARGLSRKQAALGTVRYADGSVGRILYLKSTMTGHEAPDVAYYREQHPGFPHESTADQWFSDDQFDAYRCLGEEVVDGLFQRLGYAHPADLDLRPDTLSEHLADLAVVLAPTARSRAGDLTAQHDQLQQALMDDAYAAYRRQLAPTIHAAPIADADLHELAPIVMMQLQLMENAVESLGLVDVRSRGALANRGWMNTFQRWAQSAAFRRVALICLPSFGANLSYFADVALGLGTRYTWRPLPGRRGTLALVESATQAPDGPGVLVGVAEHAATEHDDDALVVTRLAMRAGFDGRDHASGRGLSLGVDDQPDVVPARLQRRPRRAVDDDLFEPGQP